MYDLDELSENIIRMLNNVLYKIGWKITEISFLQGLLHTATQWLDRIALLKHI